LQGRIASIGYMRDDMLPSTKDLLQQPALADSPTAVQARQCAILLRQKRLQPFDFFYSI